MDCPRMELSAHPPGRRWAEECSFLLAGSGTEKLCITKSVFLVNNQRLLSWVLRLAGAVELLAFVAVVLPRSFMETAHAALGLGMMPHGPILIFMIRQASYCYGMHGISLLVIASDVERFRPFVILNGISFVLAGPVFFLIDFTSGMPLWWTLADSASCLFFGASLLILSRKKSHR